MSKWKFDQSKTEQFCSTVSDILQDIIDYPDDDREIKCKVTKRLDCIECRIDVSGNKIDPMTDGEGAEERRRGKLILIFNMIIILIPAVFFSIYRLLH